MKHKIFMAADVSKGWLDIAIHGQPGTQRIENTDAAIRQWTKGLKPERITLFAFEPTGGYERCLQRHLHEAGIRFARVHPNEVTAFRRRRGVKAKTDAMDAVLLADFAALELSGRGLTPLLEQDQILRELSCRRRQLLNSLQAERCRAAMVETKVAKTSYATVLQAIEAALAAIETAIDQHIASHSELAEMAGLLRSVKGVGPVTVHTLLAELPELGTYSGKQIAALVGLAPQQRDSGKQRGHAAIGHGRPSVRSVLFNAARIAIRFNPAMREFYQRLVETNHRPGKVALTAIMRKMLVILNAIARDKQPCRTSLAPKTC